MNTTKVHTGKRSPLAVSLLGLLSVLGITQTAQALPIPGLSPQTTNRVAAEACLPATSQKDLDVNNVRARILGGGDMWWDQGLGLARYEVPKGSGVNSLFASSLWIGGIDAGGQLKVAAQTYRQTGNDFWPGPLDTTAAISKPMCDKYDRHWKVSRKEVVDFIAYKAGEEVVDYTGVPEVITTWPGNNEYLGNRAGDPYLAPFFDKNGDGFYNADDGDYPKYKVDNSTGGGCEGFLYGDQTIWWVFNDKGNIHTETSAPAIGLEVRAQAFSFATNDEINNMTFYEYTVFNRSTISLNQSYFTYWVDADMGNPYDDIVCCDVKQGLGITYNAADIDAPYAGGSYGEHPPAIGVDFFKGPLADPNNTDDNFTYNGTGYGDGVIDNERLGMEKFMIFRNNSTIQGNPFNAIHFYNYMRALWKDGTPLTYGGSGYNSGPPCNFAVPWTTDPDFAAQNWEMTIADDWRVIQSAGPFTLKPGAVNRVTTGAVWARAQGTAKESVLLLKVVDVKAQALFDNCFKVLDGPDAPDVATQELDREVILMLSNSRRSNNFNESYAEIDANIVGVVDSLRFYRFQGYIIYQLANATVTDLRNPDVARVVAQCDIKDGIKRLINYINDPALGASVPTEMVVGEDKGIRHSFSFTQDAFNPGARLVNFKKYYYTVVSYAHNNFKTFNPLDPTALDGQKAPFFLGRRNRTTYTLIPHIPAVESNGLIAQASFGMGPEITRLEGQGNSGLEADLSPDYESKVLAAGTTFTEPLRQVVYKGGAGPIGVKVVDPLNVKAGDYEIRLVGYALVPKAVVEGTSNDSASFVSVTTEFVYRKIGFLSDTLIYAGKAANGQNIIRRAKNAPNLVNISRWELTEKRSGQVFLADTSILMGTEQILPDLGISITIKQNDSPGNPSSIANQNNGFINATVSFADNTQRWLSGLADQDGKTEENWIRSGTIAPDPNITTGPKYGDYQGFDDAQVYEKLLEGTVAPYRLGSSEAFGVTWGSLNLGATPSTSALFTNRLQNLSSVDIVFTNDKSKWTRCAVLEMTDETALSEGGVAKFDLRAHKSVDKNGKTIDDGGLNNPSDPAAANYIGENGMGWFPGYAINIETGERLNMAFGEASFLVGENGNDMLWNPTSSIRDQFFNVRFGGYHTIYVFGHNTFNTLPSSTNNPTPTSISEYDAGAFIYNKMNNRTAGSYLSQKQQVFRDAMWVAFPLLATNKKLMACDARLRLRVNRPYSRFFSGNSSYIQTSAPNLNLYDPFNTSKISVAKNNDFPRYGFNTDGIATLFNKSDIAKNGLELINVVPNPYYAFSEYEVNQLDNRIKIVNLPQKCVVSIYTVSGTLVRRFNKDDNTRTFLDWDLKNQAGIPISGGLYLIHVNVPDVGERTIKWFGSLRPIDLDSF